MNDLLIRLFQLEGLRPGDPGVTLDWTRPIPAWGWLLILLAATLLAAFSYRRLDGPRPARATLATLRALLLALIAVMISGPRLARQNQTVEPDWIVILADRSASMTLADAPTPPGATRDDQLLAALAAADPAWTDAAKERRLLWLAFDQTTRTLTPPQDRARPDLPAPLGRATDLAAILDQTARLTAARPVAGLVLLSDGRSSSVPSDDLLRQFAGRQIPLTIVPLGSKDPRADLAITKADAPPAAFVADPVPVRVTLARTPGEPQPTTLRLIDKATGETLDEQPVEWSATRPDASAPDQPSDTAVVLTASSQRPGTSTWVVQIITPQPDLVPANDKTELLITFADRPLRVAYFDGYPRWEYRYLKNLLVRERNIKSSIALLAAQRRFIQEGSDPLLTLPRTMQDWRAFDAVILGDLRPEMFSRDQLTFLRDHVAKNGAGLLMIGGPGPMPTAWRGTPLADLIPFSLASSSADADNPASPAIATWLEPVLAEPTPAADALGLLRLADDPRATWPAVLADPASGWSSLRFAQRLDPSRLKPAAEVLALARPADRASAADPAPLVVTMRYGTGRVVYVATDEIWRWRFGRGETLPERFWLPIVRMLARSALESSGQPALLTAAPRQAQVDRPVQVTVRLLDQSLLDTRPANIRVRARAADSSAAQDLQLTLTPQTESTDAGPPDTYVAAWVPTEPGEYDLTIDDPLLPSGLTPARVSVTFPDDERRVPQTDHALLASLAQKTSGNLVEPDRLAQAVRDFPDRRVRLVGTPTYETLWDKPVVWVLLMVILGLEWVGRRIIRLP